METNAIKTLVKKEIEVEKEEINKHMALLNN